MSMQEEINNIKTELKIFVRTLEVKTEELNKQLTKHKMSLQKQLKTLADDNIMLQSVPKKLTENLESLVPKIAEKLKGIVLEELNNVKHSYTEDMVQHANFLRQSEIRIEKLSEDIVSINKKRIKMFFLGIIISSGISIAASTYAASYMIQRFPTRVTIDNPENIILHDSEVSLWGTDNVKVLKGLKKNRK